MKNYERYLNCSTDEYDRKTVMSYVCRVPSDRKILPLVRGFKNESILEAGFGDIRIIKLKSWLMCLWAYLVIA